MLGFFLEAETLILPDSVQKAQWKQIVERFTSLDAETFLRDFTGQVIWVALKIAVAFAIYAAGRWIINRLVRLMDASFDRRQVDKSLRSFLRSLVKNRRRHAMRTDQNHISRYRCQRIHSLHVLHPRQCSLIMNQRPQRTDRTIRCSCFFCQLCLRWQAQYKLQPILTYFRKI